MCGLAGIVSSLVTALYDQVPDCPIDPICFDSPKTLKPKEDSTNPLVQNLLLEEVQILIICVVHRSCQLQVMPL